MAEMCCASTDPIISVGRLSWGAKIKEKSGEKEWVPWTGECAGIDCDEDSCDCSCKCETWLTNNKCWCDCDGCRCGASARFRHGLEDDGR